MSDLTQYRIYCITENAWIAGFSMTAPTVCFNNSLHTVNASSVQDIEEGSTLLNQGVYTVSSTIDASSVGTGALIIQNGGFSVFGRVYSAGINNIMNTTNSVSTSTGSLIVNGGIGVAKDFFLGGLLNVQGNTTNQGTVNISNTTNSVSISTGSMVINGGIGVAKDVYLGGLFNSTNTTDSSSTILGSIVTSGGVGIAKSLNIGSVLNVAGVVSITNTTASTVYTNGSLVISGGLGISGAVYTNSSMTVAKSFSVNSTLSGTPSTTGQYLAIGSSTFTDTATANSGTATTMAFNSIAIPTLAASHTTVTTTNAATVYIAGAPIASTNETITNAYSLWVPSGTVRFEGLSILAGQVAINIVTGRFTEEQTSGTNGGTFTQATWQKRLLNTSAIDTGAGMSLATNQVTLTILPGQTDATFIIKAWAVANKVNNHQIRVYNFTSSTAVCYGSTSMSTQFTQIPSQIASVALNITVTTVLQLHHRCTTTLNNTGLGAAAGFGTNEVYSEMFITRLN